MKKIFSGILLILFVTLLIGSCKKNETSETKTDTNIGTLPKKVLMVVTSNNRLKDGSAGGYFLPEAMDFYKELKASGYEVTIASPLGGKAPMYERNNYYNYFKTYLDSSGLINKLDSTLPLSGIKAEDYRGVFYVGGFACLIDFPANTDIRRITTGIYEKGGVVAAVCHAPAALINIALSNGELLIQNKKVTSRCMAEETDGGQISRGELLRVFPFILEEELKRKGAIYSSAEMNTPHVVTDGKLVTGQNPESSTNVARQALLLMGQ